MDAMDAHTLLYKKALGSRLKSRRIAVYGMANYDVVFDVSRERLSSVKINRVFDDVALRALKNKKYTEYNRDIDIINEAIVRLKGVPLLHKLILGGNACNISLGLSALGNRVDLNVRKATPDIVKKLKAGGVKAVKSSFSEATHHLIVQVKEDGDRFIISPDYGIKEPELVDFVDEKCDFAVYSGAHLDAKSGSVQAELLRRVKRISRKSKLYVELGSGSRMAKDNCRKVSKYADIVGMNEVEVETMSGRDDIAGAACQYYRKYMKRSSVLVVHTMKGSLAVSGHAIEGVSLAQALGHLSGSSRYIFGKYMGIGEMRRKFGKIVLHNKKVSGETGLNMSWVPGIKYSGEGLAVGSGDGYVAGFVTGFLNFCESS